MMRGATYGISTKTYLTYMPAPNGTLPKPTEVKKYKLLKYAEHVAIEKEDDSEIVLFRVELVVQGLLIRTLELCTVNVVKRVLPFVITNHNAILP